MMAWPLRAQIVTVQQPLLTVLRESIPIPGAQNAPRDRAVSLIFSDALDPASLAGAVFVTRDEYQNLIPDQRQLSTDQRVVMLTYPGYLPELQTIRVRIDGSLLRDAWGQSVDADDDGRPGGVRVVEFRTAPDARAPLQPALIIGYVFDSTTGRQPLQGATVEGYPFPRQEGDRPLPVPAATTDALGHFRYSTPELAGSGSFLLVVHKAGYSEVLHRVDVMRGGCWRVDDSNLQVVNPGVPVTRAAGATLTDPPNSPNPSITLVLPPNALLRDSSVAVTKLRSSGELRQPLPLATVEGVYTDVAGVFGDNTALPVTLRVPNTYGLPAGTQVPFGKVDHNTLQWADFRQLGTATIGTVDPTETFITVQFDHFCTCTTGFCAPLPNPVASDNSGCGDAGRCSCDGPGEMAGSSIVNLREGFLREEIQVPPMQELGMLFDLSLGYASNAAAPTVTLAARTDYQTVRPVQATGYAFKIEGMLVQAFYAATTAQSPYGTWLWDGRDAMGQFKATGSYPYSIQSTSLNAAVPVAVPALFGGPAVQSFAATYPGLLPLRSNEIRGRANLVNLQRSPYGAGWSLLREQRMHFDPDGAILVVFGNADYRRFVPDPQRSNQWISPGGDFSTLVRRPVTGFYTRSFRNGTREEYDLNGRLLQRVDRHGYSTSYTYEYDLLTRIVSPTGHSFSIGYDARGKLQSIRDSAGRVTMFSIDASGDLVQVTDAVGASRRFTYDSEHRMTTQCGSRNERSEYIYRNGRIVAARNYDTGGTTLLRERRFEPSALNGEVGEALRQGFGSLSNPIAAVLDRTDRIIDGRGVTSLRQTNDRGQTIMAQDGLQRITRYDFSNQRELVARTRTNGSLSSYQYGAFGNLTRIQELSAPGVIYSTTTIDHNGPFDLVSRVVDAEGKQRFFQHDSLGNLTAITDHNGNQSRISYQDVRFPSLPTRIVLPTGDTTTATYDSHGNMATVTDYPDPVTRPAGRVTRLAYDVAGNLLTVTDPRSLPTTYAYDGLGRVRSVTDARSATIGIDYEDPACQCSTRNITRVRLSNGSTIAWSYDGLDRMVTRVDQLAGLSRYTWDAEDNLCYSQNRNGEVVAYEYDGAGQMVRKLVPGAGETTYVYDSEGAATDWNGPDANLKFVYDFLGRTTSAIVTIDCHVAGSARLSPITHRCDYTFDRVGNRLTMQESYGLGSQVLTYDDLHRLVALTTPSQGNQSWTFAYDSSGRRTLVLPAPFGPQTSHGYDLAGQVTTITHATTPMIQLRYTHYDPGGNILTRVRQAGAQILSQDFTYDETSQLMSARFSQLFGDMRVNRTYTYDSANRLLADADYAYMYDDEGRLISRERQGSGLKEWYSYDAENRLRSYVQTIDSMGTPQTIVSAAYGYDPLGRRILKCVNQVSRRYIHDGYNVLHEVDGAGRVARSYTNGINLDEQLMFRDSSGAVRFYCHDMENSVVALADGTGNRVQHYEYDETGNVIARLSATEFQPFQFSGREFDPESETIHLRARQYDPIIGRFVVEDPVGLVGGYNLYGYLKNRPVMGRDPLGTIGLGKPPPRKPWDITPERPPQDPPPPPKPTNPKPPPPKEDEYLDDLIDELLGGKKFVVIVLAGTCVVALTIAFGPTALAPLLAF